MQQRLQWQPSDTMWVQFEASSAAGLWLTYTAFSDAVETDSVYNEALQPSAQHVVHSRIPAVATLGVPAVTTVFAIDPFGQEVRRSIQTPSLVDVTPPSVQLSMWPPPYFAMTTAIGGTYFVGDSIVAMPSAGDNHGLTTLVWHATPGTYADSVLANGNVGAGGSIIRIPVRPEWADNLQFKLAATDLAGNVSDTLTTPAHAFTIYPTLTRPTVTATVTGDVNNAMIDTARSAVYVLQGNQHRLAIYSLTTLQQTGAVPLDGYVQSFDMTPGGDSLIVVLRQQLAVIDLRNPTAAPSFIPLSDVDTLAGQTVGAVRIAANDRLFVIRGSPIEPRYALLEVNLATGAQRVRSDAGAAQSISRSLDQKVLTVALDGCVERYDATSDAFGPCTPVPPGGAPTVDRTGQHFAIQLTAFDASLAPIGTVRLPWDFGTNNSFPTIISADGAYIFYYYSPTGLIRARVSDGAIMDRTLVPGFRSTGFTMANSPDGTKMLLASDDGASGTGQLTVIDVRDADAKALQLARAPLSIRPPPVRSAVVAPPVSRRAGPAHWDGRSPAARPRRGAATTVPPDRDRS